MIFRILYDQICKLLKKYIYIRNYMYLLVLIICISRLLFQNTSFIIVISPYNQVCINLKTKLWEF